MDRSVLLDNALNGGFPEPPENEGVRVVAAHHEYCGAATRVRLPSTVPAAAVRRFHCAGCAQAFEARRVEELESEVEASAAPDAATIEPAEIVPEKPRPKLPKLDPQSRSWRLLSIPIAAALVIAALLALRGGGDATPQISATSATATGHGAKGAAASSDHGAGSTPGGSGSSSGSKQTKFVRESSYSLAIPAGWERVDPPAGATFAAVAADGGADATLWITQDPKLDFPTFISQSLAQLQTLAGSAQIIERVPAPTPEGTIVRLAADAPAGQPSYEVTLRVAGPYRFYLATSVEPEASSKATDGVDLITGSFTPEPEG